VHGADKCSHYLLYYPLARKNSKGGNLTATYISNLMELLLTSNAGTEQGTLPHTCTSVHTDTKYYSSPTCLDKTGYTTPHSYPIPT
jgi:hypothetical protein